MNEQDKQRRRALFVVEAVIFGYLGVVFLLQLYLYSQRNW